MSINLKSYPSLGFDLKIGWILLALTIGIIVAAVIITLQRNGMISLIKKLYRCEAKDENSAKALSELGLDNIVIRGLLKGSGRIRRIVKAVGEKEYTYEEYIALSKEKKKKKRVDGVKKSKEKITLRYYLCDFESSDTKNLVEARRSPLLNTILFCILMISIYVCVMLLMPDILDLLNDFIANTK
jgi:hypothetical protein